MTRKNIAVIFGGRGRENKISRLGAAHILSEIDRERYLPIPIYIDRHGAWHLGDGRGVIFHPALSGRRGMLVSDGERIPIDCALPLLHGDFGEDGKIQGALETAGIPFVGCDAPAGGICSDKILTKMIAKELGIKCTRSVYSTASDSPDRVRSLAEGEIGYPMFIKPAGLGSSFGCSLVTEPGNFEAAYKEAGEAGGRVLFEEYLEGAREIECGYLKSATRGEIFSHPGEVFACGVYTYEKKYKRGKAARITARADIGTEAAELIREYSRMLVLAIGIRHLARIDFFLHEGEIIFNEINTMPGFTSGSLYPLMMNAEGIAAKELITELIEVALC